MEGQKVEIQVKKNIVTFVGQVTDND